MAHKHRRGFIKESEDYALEFREELDVAPYGPLCPLMLAEHLAIPVWKLSEHPALPLEAVTHFFNGGQNDFSAATLTDGSYREIIHNDSHHPYRQNSNIAHELAHIILGHPPKPPMLKDGCRNFDKVMEREAHDLGYTLLIPKVAALYAVEQFMDRNSACAHYGVSKQLLEFRIRKTDANGWARNRAKMRFR